ncbi:MAG TPA: hypothetical protein VJT67_04710, partial [Longimicrobiaceae bacterium]|nr:hypothetical protein [Longimicrobiaceae bacterium]
DVRLLIVYYSTYGTNHQMAETAAEAARDAGAEVRLAKCRETAPEGVVNGQDAWRAQAERTAHSPRPRPTTWSGPTPTSSARPPVTG